MNLYKVEVEEIENKLKLLKKSRKESLVKFVMISTGLLVLLFASSDENKLTLTYTMFTFFFLQSFALYYYIHPIVGKLELLEQDINNLKAAANVQDERHY